jgi:hypothetical protein
VIEVIEQITSNELKYSEGVFEAAGTLLSNYSSLLSFGLLRNSQRNARFLRFMARERVERAGAAWQCILQHVIVFYMHGTRVIALHSWKLVYQI